MVEIAKLRATYSNRNIANDARNAFEASVKSLSKSKKVNDNVRTKWRTLWLVVLHNDDDNSFSNVIEALNSVRWSCLCLSVNIFATNPARAGYSRYE